MGNVRTLGHVKYRELRYQDSTYVLRAEMVIDYVDRTVRRILRISIPLVNLEIYHGGLWNCGRDER